MTDTPSPLSPDDVDALLSAELDGEFDAAAADLGLDPADARARLAVTPGIEARRAAFAGAVDAIANVPELDEVTAARLRAAALDASADDRAAAQQRRRRSRRLGIAGGIAAALVLVVGVVAAVQASSGSDADNTAAPGSVAESDTANGAPSVVPNQGRTDLGDFTDLDQLVRSVGDQAAREPNVTTSAPSRSSAKEYNAAYEPPSARVGDVTGRRCTNEALALANGETAAYYGTATLAGEPVEVWGYEPGDWTLLVLDETCAVVAQRQGG